MKTSIYTKAIDQIEDEDLRREFYLRRKSLFTLTFSYEFTTNHDTVFFAHFFPYTFTNLEKYLSKISNPQSDNHKFLRIDTLCKSLAQNPCYMLTITNKISSYLSASDEARLINKSDAGKNMMAKRLQKYDQSSVKRRKGSRISKAIQSGQSNVFKDNRL